MRFSLVLAVFVSGCATAERNAVTGQIADVGSTGVALAMDASEAHPLGWFTLGLKVIQPDMM